MPAVTYNGARTTGHGKSPPTTVIATQTKVFVQGQAVVCAGDPIVPHGHPGVTIPTQSKLFIQGRPVILIGDKTTCGDTIAQGSSILFVG